MREAAKQRKSSKRGRLPVPQKADELHVANEALKATVGAKERFMVRASDGDEAEFADENLALRRAMTWKLAGHDVTVWRKCEFEMVLRIVG